MQREVTNARPSLGQVAAEAGVSKSTASKVVNDRPDVSAETRARVKQVIARLGYVPAPSTSGTAGQATIALVFRTLSDIYAMRVLEGVAAAASAQNTEVLISVFDVDAGDSPPLSDAWFRHQATQQRAGIILVTTELTRAQRLTTRSLGLNVVHIDPINPLDDGTVSVGSTNFVGGMQATQHLLDLGHRRIAFAGGRDTSLPARERLQGFLATLSAAGVEPDPSLVQHRTYGYDEGFEMATTFLTSPNPPTAIFAGSDATALGVLEAARRLGVRVPEDLSVVGFDDTYAATTSAPALTTVRQPIVEMGRVALRTLLQLAKGESIDTHHVQLSTQLVVRESTAPPAA